MPATRHSHADFKRALLGVSKQVHGNIAARGQPDQLEHFLGSVMQRLELADALPEGISITLCPHRGREDVLVHGLTTEQIGDLKAATQPSLVDLLRVAAIDAITVEPDFTGAYGQPSRNEVEQGGFSGAVRADNRQPFAFSHLKVQAP